jgi:hypothetical protein
MLGMLFATPIFAQDTLYFVNGQKVLVKLLEIHPSEIVFKRNDVPDGPSIFVIRSQVEKVVYANGLVDQLFKSDPLNFNNNTPMPRVLAIPYDKNLPLETNGKVIHQKGKIISKKELKFLFQETKCSQATSVLKENIPGRIKSAFTIGMIFIMLGITAMFLLPIDLLSVGLIALLIGLSLTFQSALTFKKERIKWTNKIVNSYNEFIQK